MKIISKKIKIGVLSLLATTTAGLPLLTSVSCGQNSPTVTEKKQFFVTTTNGFSLSNKQKAIENEPWSSDLLIDNGNKCVVTNVIVKRLDETILNKDTDYLWNWTWDDDSVAGNITINNPTDDIFITVESTKKNDNIAYDGKNAYVYPDCDDDLEFYYYNSVLPVESSFDEISIVSITDANDSTALDPTSLIIKENTTIINRQFNVSIGLDTEKYFENEIIDCKVSIKFVYILGQDSKQEFTVSNIPVQINKNNKGNLVYPFAQPDDDKYLYVTENPESTLSISYVLNEKRAPTTNCVCVSVLPEYSSDVVLVSPVSIVSVYNDVFKFDVKLTLSPNKVYDKESKIRFGLRFQYSKSNYSFCDCDSSDYESYIHYAVNTSVENAGQTEMILLDAVQSSVLQLRIVNPTQNILDDVTKIIVEPNDNSIRVNKVEWLTNYDNNHVIGVTIAPQGTIATSDVYFKLAVKIKKSETETTDLTWSSPTYHYMTCKKVTNNYLNIQNGVLYGFSSQFKNGDATCDSFNALVIPETVTEIANKAFYGYASGSDKDLRLKNSKIKWLIFPNEKTCDNPKLAKIGNWAFEECTNLVGELYIPASVETIGQYAFKNCTNFNSLVFATGLYGEDPSKTKLNDIAVQAFYGFGTASGGCGNLTFPSMGTIHHHGFQYSNFTGTISINGGISTHVFEFCNLSKLVITSSISIQDESFHYCQNLKTIDVSLLGPNPVDICMSGGDNDHFEDIGGGSGTILVHPNATEDNRNKWREKFFRLPSGWVVVNKN